jgi:hypothetical protein
MFKYQQNSLPLPLRKLFNLNSEIHKRNTRQGNDFYTKKCRTTLATQHISSTGPKIWNSMPTEIKNDTLISLKAFTTKCIGHIRKGYGNDVAVN